MSPVLELNYARYYIKIDHFTSTTTYGFCPRYSIAIKLIFSYNYLHFSSPNFLTFVEHWEDGMSFWSELKRRNVVRAGVA